MEPIFERVPPLVMRLYQEKTQRLFWSAKLNHIIVSLSSQLSQEDGRLGPKAWPRGQATDPRMCEALNSTSSSTHMI